MALLVGVALFLLAVALECPASVEMELQPPASALPSQLAFVAPLQANKGASVSQSAEFRFARAQVRGVSVSGTSLGNSLTALLRGLAAVSLATGLCTRRCRRTVRMRAARRQVKPSSTESPIAVCRRSDVLRGSGGIFVGGACAMSCAGQASAETKTASARTGEVVRVVNGIRHKQLGSSGIAVSEIGLGTQRWASADFNAPDESLCHRMMDRAILEGGVNLVDTAEQYPIPSGPGKPQGLTEEVIGRWVAQDRTRRDKIVIATKITGGLNVNARNIRKDVEGSLKRLQTDHVDFYLTHWSFRISQPQQNWGQSLQYRQDAEQYARSRGQATFEEVAKTMDELVREGKIRGWGCCNESPYGATRLVATAKSMGTVPPCVFQNDYSILNRRCEENGLFEMMSPYNENVGFMAYNVLAGGMLTGKYLEEPAALDQDNPAKVMARSMMPRGRMDDVSWGRTLYRYRSEAADEATRSYAALAKDAGMSLIELSLRWARQRSGVTTALVGQSSMEQLEEDLKAYAVDKPLPESLMWEIDRVHMRNRLPIFANRNVGKDWGGEGEIGEPIP